MEGQVQVLYQLVCVLYLLLLPSSSSHEKSRVVIPQYVSARSNKEQQKFRSGGRYSSNATATAAGRRAQGMDTILAKQALLRILSGGLRTGLAYNVSLAPSLPGIACQMMRLRAGSLRRRGLTFNDFHIPKGVRVRKGGPYVFLIYKRIPLNSTSLFYTLPSGYTFISPIVGMVIHTSSSSTSFNVSSSEMELLSPLSTHPISIAIPIGKQPRMHSSTPICAFFDINGTFFSSTLSSPPNTCSSLSLMDSAIVLPPQYTPPPPPLPPPPSTTTIREASKGDPSRPWKVALIAVLASFFGFAIMGTTVLVAVRVQDKCQIGNKPKELDHNQETLHTSMIGHTRAPTASPVRTKPTLETESLRS